MNIKEREEKNMGKPTSCFKIITCGSDTADKDDLNVDEVSDSFLFSFLKFFPGK